MTLVSSGIVMYHILQPEQGQPKSERTPCLQLQGHTEESSRGQPARSCTQLHRLKIQHMLTMPFGAQGRKLHRYIAVLIVHEELL